MWVVFLIEQMKKKLVGITREHEALVNFVETNKHIWTEKEKQKVKEKAFSIITLNHMTPNLLNRQSFPDDFPFSTRCARTVPLASQICE